MEVPPNLAQSAGPFDADPDGPLPLLLLALTVVTGLVDAVSYLTMNHVFVANMTGNVAFLGFAAGGASEFSVRGSIIAMAAFLGGASVGGRLGPTVRLHRGRLLARATCLQSSAFLVALGISIAYPGLDGPISQGAMVAFLGFAMGLQNASARRLNVKDLTTTVLTMTLTGLAADRAVKEGPRYASRRRYAAIFAMFLGAGVGSLVVREFGVGAVLAIALALLLSIAITSIAYWSSNAPWTNNHS